MAYNNQQNGQSLYHDNHGYVRDGSEASTYAQSPIEPAPRQFLPRIITGSEVGGQKIKPESQPPAYGAEHPQPRFAVKNNDPGQIATITPAQPPATGDEGPGDERDTWDNPFEFLLSCISMSVGLGNVWRFPGVAARNGGGAFLIPYLIVLLVIVELYVNGTHKIHESQAYKNKYAQHLFQEVKSIKYGQVKVWNMAPIFKGVGYGSITAVCCVVSYYVALMGITLFFFFSSFQKELPWGKCDDEGKPFNCSEVSAENYAAYYYNYEVLPQIPKIDDGLGELNWRVSLCLVLAWILIFLSLVKGVKSSGKVAYFTAIFPYVVLLILLIRGVTLKGAWSGIKYFITPEWSVLYKPKVWYNAISQCFFSLSAGFGPVIMFSSYNNFRQNVYKDALIISFMDTFTSLLAGCTIFSVMGNLVEESETLEFEDIDGGPGLAFVLYPQAITKFGSTPFPQIFAVLFFLMLFTLGLGSATSLAGGIITIICDQFTTMKRWLVTLIVCTGGCLVGLLYVTEGGMLMLDLIDHYGSGFVVYVMAMLECAGISYVYGLSNICNDIEFMLGRHVGIYWRICWGFILPVGLLANLLYYLISEPEFQSGPFPYPQIATIFGWLLTAFAAGLIPAWAIHAVATRKKETLKEKFVDACKPTHRWGPQNKKLRSEWLAFRAQKDAEASKKRFLIF